MTLIAHVMPNGVASVKHVYIVDQHDLDKLEEKPVTESKVADKEIEMEELFNKIMDGELVSGLEVFDTMSKEDLIFFIHWLFANKKIED
jgi:hypothetical protein